MPMRFVICLSLLVGTFAPSTRAQLQSGGAIEPIRVTVSMNEDGSRTAYEFDTANRKAVATTTGANGKLVSKIRYELDDAGRFAKGQVLGPDEKLRFKTLYKYDAAGRLAEETQLTREEAVKLRLVYAYDATGKPSGYSVYDSSGKLLGQTRPKGTANAPAASPARKKAR